jgi:hypothetical protein
MIRRMEALRACIRVLPPADDKVSTTALLLVRAEKVANWVDRPDGGDTRLSGPGYLYEFATLTGGEELMPDDLRRVHRRVASEVTCQVAMEGRRVSGLAFRLGRAGAFELRQNP